jgi:hypothetical protein
MPAIVAILLPTGAFGFWSVYEVRLEGFRERPWIKVVGAWTNESTVSFELLFDPGGKTSLDEYLHLELYDENGISLSRTLLRGERIRGVMMQEAALRFGLESLWKKGEAMVYKFTVNSSLMKKSRLSREFGSGHDENGNPSGGGVVEWCYLFTLAQASPDANENGAATGSQPIRSEIAGLGRLSDGDIPTLHICPDDVVQSSIQKWAMGTNKVMVRWAYTEAGAKKALLFWEMHAGDKTRTAVGSFVAPPCISQREEPVTYGEWKKGWLKSRTDKFFAVSKDDAEAIVDGLKKK